jgi:hypothetical protein
MLTIRILVLRGLKKEYVYCTVQMRVLEEMQLCSDFISPSPLKGKMLHSSEVSPVVSLKGAM